MKAGYTTAGIGLKKNSYKDRWDEFKKIRNSAKGYLKRTKELIYEDSKAFEEVMKAYKIPRDNPDRKVAIQKALIYAAQVPSETLELSLRALELCRHLENIAPKSAISDVYVARYQAIAAFKGALENVKINIESLEESGEKQKLLQTMEYLREKFREYEREVDENY